jgi:pimeloyl-ACP methyl ester carboxylesterase
MQVVVDGLLTQYLRVGKGRKVVVLHGWGDNAVSWGSFANVLAQKYDVIVPDLPGFGGTQAPPSVWGLDDYAAFVAEFLAKINVRADVIIGHSNGGAIAIRGLASHTLKATKLVLVASAGIRGENSARKGLLKAATKTGKVVSAPLPGRVRRRLRSKWYKVADSDMLVVEHMRDTFEQIVSQDIRTDAATVKQPTLLVYGDHDSQTPVRYGQVLHEAIQHSELEIIPRGGHFLQLENEPELLQLVEDFLG